MSEKDFFDRFQYDSEKDILGSGGFGTVYRAHDTLKDRYVAIKISQVKDLFGKFTLLNEVKLSEGIDDHANVARYEFGLRITRPFLTDYAVMAYYEEGNLDMVLRKQHGILSQKEQYDIVEGLLEGIKHLHSENVIHRDLKLANILMLKTKQGQWRPKIADFGLSRQMEDYDASIANSAIGITTAYAAPEQIENKPIKKNVDLWALAVIVYRLLTGEMPFAAPQGANSTTATVEISRKITQLELPEKLNTLPEPYQTIIRRCFVKDTKERAQSADELLAILKGKDATNPVKNDPDTQPKTASFSTVDIAETRLLGAENVDSTEIAPSFNTVNTEATPSVKRTFNTVNTDTTPSVKPIENEYTELFKNEDATEIFQEETVEPSRGVPKWIWAIVAVALLLIGAWGMGLFKPKPMPADPCNTALFPELDCDNDGVLNKNDKCPQVKGQDGNGCPVTKPTVDNQKDTDGDGVKDFEDNCPTIKGSRNAHGCRD
jgi:serine/threonine protein kinase